MAGTVAVIGVMALSFAALGGVGEALGKRDGGDEPNCRRTSCTTVTQTRTRTEVVRETTTVTGTETATEKTRVRETLSVPAATEVQADTTITGTTTVPGNLVRVTSTSAVSGSTTRTVATVTSTTTVTESTDSTRISTVTSDVIGTATVTVERETYLVCFYDLVGPWWELDGSDPPEGVGSCPGSYDP